MQAIEVAREVVRCPHCNLNQFTTHSDLCRRCRRTYLQPPDPTPAPAPPAGSETGEEIIETAATLRISIGSKVRRFRFKEHLSQRGLARRLGVPRTYISKIETCHCLVTIPTLERLAKCLNIEMWTLLPDFSQIRKKQIEAILADPFMAQIAEDIHGMNANDRATLGVLIKMFAEGNYVFEDWIPL